MEKQDIYVEPVSEVWIPDIGTGDISGVHLPEDTGNGWE
mgnify:CR=1 FL=1